MTPAQCRAARALKSITQPDLALAASVGISTVVDFEKERRKVAQPSIDAMESALTALGVIFIPENGGGAGVRIRKTDGHVP